MNIYSIKFEVEKENKNTKEISVSVGHFELGANAIHIASAMAVSYLDAAFGKEGYRILSINYEDVHILNWPGYAEELAKEGDANKLLNEWFKFFGPKANIEQ